MKFLSKYFWVIFVGIIVIGLCSGIVSMSGGYTVQITTPDYNGDGGETYLIKAYREENGCVIFTDMMGIERRICGEYRVNDYNQLFKK